MWFVSLEETELQKDVREQAKDGTKWSLDADYITSFKLTRDNNRSCIFVIIALVSSESISSAVSTHLIELGVLQIQ